MRKEYVDAFSVIAYVDYVKPIGSGHINETYSVTLRGFNNPSYILQKINQSVFPNIEQLCNNIQRVTKHLEEFGGDQYQIMHLIKAQDGKLWHQASDGNFWRLFNFIPDSYSFDLAPSNRFAKEAGKAYAWFIKTLSTLDQPPLFEIIPKFHNITFRITELKASISENKVGRLKRCQAEVDFYLDRCDEMIEFDNLIGTKDIPLRVTHNDTKINNILFNSEGKAISVIDLDTVMPGVVHYDFGDAIRTIAAKAQEDEIRSELIGISIELYHAFAEGFLKEIGISLSQKEFEYLPKSPRILTFIMGVRFLTDYLRGDAYYKVKHPEHNIQRARNQMALIQDMERKFDLMKL